MLVIDSFGIPRQSDDVRAVERLEKLKEKHGSNPWPVIEECFTIWSSRHPTHWESYLFYIDDIKETRKEKKFASTVDKKTGGTLRYTIDIPQPVMFMIRCLYTPEELDMGREFMRQFARKFPKMRIAERL